MLANEIDFADLIIQCIAGRLQINSKLVELDKTRFITDDENKRAVREVKIAGNLTGVLYDLTVGGIDPVKRELDQDAMVACENKKIDEIVELLTKEGYAPTEQA